MTRRRLTNALIVCITALLTLALLEAAVRVIGDTDIDGQFTFMGYALEPYALPIGSGENKGFMLNKVYGNRCVREGEAVDAKMSLLPRH